MRAACESTYLILLAWTATACTTWVSETPAKFRMEQGNLKGPLRVLLSDSSIVDLLNVRVSADSVFGTVYSNWDNQNVAIARSKVIAVDRREFSSDRTVGFIALLAAASFVLFWIAFCAEYCSGN